MSFVSACTLDCPDSCSLIVKIDPSGRVSFRGNPDHPYTQGFICKKGLDFPRRLTHKDRITQPLLKDGSGFKTIDWAAALELCRKKIMALRPEPQSILHLKGHAYRGVLAQASGVFFRRLGARGLYGSLCDDTGIEASIRDFGRLDQNDPRDITRAASIVNWGRDLSRSSFHFAALVKKARKGGAGILTVSPGGDGNQAFSDRMIGVGPGCDRFLAAAVIKLMFERDRIRPEVLDRAANWEKLKSLLDKTDFQDLVAWAGVGTKEAEMVFSMYDRPGPTATIIGWGLQRYDFGGQNVRFIDALAFLAGHIGRSGGGVYFNIGSGRNFSSWDDEPEQKQPCLALANLANEILTARPPIKMIWVDGFNPVNQTPDSRAMIRAFDSCDFVVAAEAFMNDTAQRADLILPPALMTEREEAIGSCAHNFVNYSAKIIDPPGQAKSDFEIMSLLGRRLDPPIILPSAEECLRKGLASPSLDTSLEELKEKGFARSRHRDVAFQDMIFGHRDGKFRLPERLDPEPSPSGKWPLRLLSLVRREFLHSQIFEDDMAGRPKAWISPDSEAAAGLDLEKPVWLATPLGRLEVQVEFSAGLHPKVVIVRRGGWMKRGRNANVLIAARTTDMGGGAAIYQQGARLENS